VVGNEGFQSATFEWPSKNRDRISVRYLASDAPHPRAFDTLKIEADGSVVERRRYADKPSGDRALASMFPLHSGRFFGLPGTIAFMFASLGMPLFAVTGWMLYLERRRKRVLRRLAVAAAD
jgi:sulfite reductase (NADPH) flavoprotein alpha-component